LRRREDCVARGEDARREKHCEDAIAIAIAALS
jgi:hypothetical protein